MPVVSRLWDLQALLADLLYAERRQAVATLIAFHDPSLSPSERQNCGQVLNRKYLDRRLSKPVEGFEVFPCLPFKRPCRASHSFGTQKHTRAHPHAADVTTPPVDRKALGTVG